MRCTRGDKIQGFSWDTSQIILLIANGCLGRGILRLAPKSGGRTAFALLSAFKGGTKELRATSPWLSCTLFFEDRELSLIGASEEIARAVPKAGERVAARRLAVDRQQTVRGFGPRVRRRERVGHGFSPVSETVASLHNATNRLIPTSCDFSRSLAASK